MDLSGLRLGQPVHGAVGEITMSGFIVDFQRHRGFLPRWDLSTDQRLALRDEVEGWITELDPKIGWIGLSLHLFPADRPTSPNGVMMYRPDLTPPGRPRIRMGEGVPFHELYLRRRSQRSWSRG